MRGVLATMLAALVLGAGSWSSARQVPGNMDDTIYRVLPKDAIPAIDRPEFETVAAADRVMRPDELMIGVVGIAEQRAYSTWQLDRHEIVNDVFEGRPIAVTW
jgi:hypothetical protein